MIVTVYGWRNTHCTNNTTDGWYDCEANMGQLDFWFSLGSTYTYLSAMRIGELSHNKGVTVRWRPFQLRAILEELAGLPFKEGSPKTDYMWLDLGRQANKLGLKPILPAPYPNLQAHLTNRVAHIGFEEDWGQAFTLSYYHRWFETDKGAMEESDVALCLTEIGQNSALVLDKAMSDEIIAGQDAETEKARALGIFGSPTFAVNGELFWGNDRLEDAIEYSLQVT